MKERPILFSAPMVRALLPGTKTQTRRVAKITHRTPGLAACLEPPPGARIRTSVAAELCPYGQPGDRLWVREAWKAHSCFDHLPPREIPPTHVWYLADSGYKAESRTRASMHMPRWASRIALEITGVRVERLQDISEADAQAEGIDYDPGEGGTYWVPGLGCGSDSAAGSYRRLWQSINGPDSWAANPWLWVLQFKRLEACNG